jgi:hypothetical protein
MRTVTRFFMYSVAFAEIVCAIACAWATFVISRP